MLSNLEELHSEVFQMREEIRQLHAWNAVMFKFIYNEQYEKFQNSQKSSKKSSILNYKTFEKLGLGGSGSQLGANLGPSWGQHGPTWGQLEPL